ncbi:MAG: phosphatase PAP2 family protein [Alphaproteobacteria bacterium]|nr:phosphatase PAP2 family protein [Alphaproteobacteria bacterium]
MEILSGLDVSIITFVNSYAQRSPLLDQVVGGLNRVTLWGGAVVTGMLCYTWLAENGRLSSRNMAFVRSVVGATVAMLLTRGFQLVLPFRYRPRHDPELDFVLPVGVNAEALQDWSAFPSDNAGFYMAVSTAVFLVDRRAGVFACAWTVVFILLPRLYSGAHYPSDLIAGAGIGIVVMWGAFRAPLPEAVPRLLHWWEARHAVSLYVLAFLFAYQTATTFNDARRAAKFVLESLTGLEV